jgi:hypothetical protein
MRCMDMTTQTPAEAESGDLPRFDSALTEFGTIILLAAVWVVAAVVRPEATFHLGPLLLPLVPLVTTPRDEDRTRQVLFGTALGAFVIGILTLTSHLNGPAFAPFASATAESVAVLFGAGVVGLVLARSTR